MKRGTKKSSKSLKETYDIAKIFLNKILKERSLKKPREALVIGLSGDLGAGKTAFTKAVARHFKIKHTVNSPTFVIIKKYPIKNLKGYKSMFHLDAYRLKNEKELLRLGWEEILNDREHIIFVEWPENVSKIIPAHAKFIHISTDKNGQRRLELK